MKKNFESGRSLLEIISMMAIIGVLTVGSINMVYSGLNTIRAKYILEQIQLRVNEAISITELSQNHKKMAYTPEYVNKTAAGTYGYAFITKDISMDKTSLAYYLAKDDLKREKKVQIELNGRISPKVCEKLKEKILTAKKIIDAKAINKKILTGLNFTEANADGADFLDHSCPTNEIAQMTFVIIGKPEKS